MVTQEKEVITIQVKTDYPPQKLEDWAGAILNVEDFPIKEDDPEEKQILSHFAQVLAGNQDESKNFKGHVLILNKELRIILYGDWPGAEKLFDSILITAERAKESNKLEKKDIACFNDMLNEMRTITIEL